MQIEGHKSSSGQQQRSIVALISSGLTVHIVCDSAFGLSLLLSVKPEAEHSDSF